LNWYPGEPNNHNGIDEDCVGMEWGRGGREGASWSDAPCDATNYDPHALCGTDCTE